MTEPRRDRPLPRLGRHLLYWFAGCAIVMVVAYTSLLDYYFELGVDVRTLSLLERTAQEYQQSKGSDPSAALPSGENLLAYRTLDALPDEIRGLFRRERLRHGELERRVNQDFDDDDDDIPVDTGGLCVEGRCDLIFLYPYRLAEDDWLYLLHGVVGSDRVYDEFQFTEQVAFAVGLLFAILVLVVSFLVVRSIYGPLRTLERWSADLGADGADLAKPDLRFHELDALASRLSSAVGRMRESVEKEKLFLRHASHELRTPISILSANVELIDRLTSDAERSEAEQAAFLRQYRALDDIQQLTETLLWVNRQSESLPRPEAVDLRRELDSIAEQYAYLLDGRPVALVVEGADQIVQAPLAAVRIVLSNLLRNAFQYAVAGEVRVSIGPGEVRIENANSADQDGHAPQPDDGDYGFGLGLELVALICERLDWRCETLETGRGWSTTVRF